MVHYIPGYRYPGTPNVLTASTWKPALVVGPGTGNIEKGCHSEALIAGQLTWTYAPGLNLYPLHRARSFAYRYTKSGGERELLA